MQVNACRLSHGAALEALCSAQEHLRFLYSFSPEVNDKQLDQAMHSVARASRSVFASYLRQPRRSEELAKDDLMDKVA